MYEVAKMGDSLDGFTSEVEGQEAKTSGSVVYVIWDHQLSTWVQGGEKTPFAVGPYILVGMQRQVAKRAQKGVGVVRVVKVDPVPPGAKFPDVAAMNEKVPREQWIEEFGKMSGPYITRTAIDLYEPNTAEKVRWVARMATSGHAICVSRVADKVQTTRFYRGELVYPLLKLSKAWMPTQFGGCWRPEFEILEFLTPKQHGISQQVADTPAIENKTAAEQMIPEPAEEKTAESAPRTRKIRSKSFMVGDRVAPIRLGEEMNDKLPW